MCIVHKGFRGFRAVSHSSILGGILIGLKPAIPYDTIHSTSLAVIFTDNTTHHNDNIQMTDPKDK